MDEKVDEKADENADEKADQKSTASLKPINLESSEDSESAQSFADKLQTSVSKKEFFFSNESMC